MSLDSIRHAECTSICAGMHMQCMDAPVHALIDCEQNGGDPGM